MEAKKVNIFAFLMMIVMCVVSICVCVGGKDKDTNVSDEMLALYKKIDELDKKLAQTKGDSAYEVAVQDGFTGNEHEWLLSLKGKNGSDAEPASISTHDIYTAYLTETEQNETDYSYEEFLLYYYSVSGKLDKKSATQLACSSTVDICYSYSGLTYYVQVNGSKFVPNETLSGIKGGISAGAGIIYQMLDTDGKDGLDTAYIITNYHVAYIDNYSNDPNYVVYADYTVGLNSSMEYDYIVKEYFLADDYKKVDTITRLSVDEAIDKHFLIGGDTGDYYGIYLCGYQTEDYKLNATFVGGSADNDIAILKIERENQTSKVVSDIFFDSGMYEPATIGDSTELVGGEDVIAVGNPLIANMPNSDEEMTVSQAEQIYIDAMLLSSTSGIVSSVSNEIAMDSLIESEKSVTMRLIRVDAAINSGNSGGGLYDLYGKLIGIVNSKIASSSYDNVGFAIPINIATAIADQVISQCDGVTKSSTNTRIKTLTTENLGFSIKNGMSNSSVGTDSNGHKVWNVSYNVLVESVQDGTFAKTKGLQEGDIIMKVSFDDVDYVAGVDFDLKYELKDLLLHVKLNCTQIKFTISRDGAEQTITFAITEDCFKEIC